LLIGKQENDKGNVFTGYGLINTKLDVNNEVPAVYEAARRENQRHVDITPREGSTSTVRGVSQVDLTSSVFPSTSVSTTGGAAAGGNTTTKTGVTKDTTLEELRNYIVLMDQYSLHNFLIYEGKTLKDTPEFQSFQRTYQYKWGSISSIIYQLEEYMNKNDIKLAIVNGPRVYELAKLNMPMLKKPELHSCIANIEQIELTTNFGNDLSKKQMIGMVIKIQSLMRTFLAMRKYKRKRKALKSAIMIQSMARYMLERARYRIKLRAKQVEWDEKCRQLQETLALQWKRSSFIYYNHAMSTSPRLNDPNSARNTPRNQNNHHTASSLRHRGMGEIPSIVNEDVKNDVAAEIDLDNTIPSSIPRPIVPLLSTAEITSSSSMPLEYSLNPTLFNQKRLIIVIPSISASPYLRLEYENFAALQNTLISNLYLLADENVHMIYISPFLMSNYQLSYHEKFLSLMGISLLPKRLTVITPEVIERLPSHLSLSQQLWSSSIALNKIRSHIRQLKPSIAYIVSSSLSWAEKRISYFLNIPLLGPDVMTAEALSSKSFLKNFFFQSGINYAIGAHDIYSTDELLLAITRLIAANLGIMRWNIRLNNGDYNGESTLQLDVEKIPLILELRTEQFSLLGDKDNTASWFSRPVQLAVRKRILATLSKEFPLKVKICRKDIFSSHYEAFSRLIKHYGCVIEAEPIEKVGYILSLVFISPGGEVSLLGGVQEYCDDYYQVQGYCYPQTLTPPIALNGVSQLIASKLYSEYRVVGYVNIRFIALWDDLDQQPRLWANDIKFGILPLHGALGTAAIMTNPTIPDHTGGGTGIDDLPFHLVPTLAEGERCFSISLFFF
jgi:hypothetical protein